MHVSNAHSTHVTHLRTRFTRIYIAKHVSLVYSHVRIIHLYLQMSCSKMRKHASSESICRIFSSRISSSFPVPIPVADPGGGTGGTCPPLSVSQDLASPRIYSMRRWAPAAIHVRVYYCEPMNPWRAQAASCHQLLFSCTKAQSSRRTLHFG